MQQRYPFQKINEKQGGKKGKKKKLLCFLVLYRILFADERSNIERKRIKQAQRPQESNEPFIFFRKKKKKIYRWRVHLFIKKDNTQDLVKVACCCFAAAVLL